MNDIDIENMRAIILHQQDGSLDEWLNSLKDSELEYILSLLQEFLRSRETFINSI